MSRSAPEENLINPCKTWYQFDGDKGQIKLYDKETKTNKIIPLPFRFLVIDELITTTGYNEPEKIGYYSNEVRNIKDKLVVRSKNGIEFEGEYAQAKEKLGTKGLDFCQSVYIMFYDAEKKPTLGNIKMKGAALGPWFDFKKANKIMEIGVSVASFKEGKKGKVVYQMPVFTAMKTSEASNEAAIILDKELQEYLKAYLIRNQSPTVKTEPAPTEIKSDLKDPAIKQAIIAEAKVEEKVEDIKVDDIFGDDEPF